MCFASKEGKEVFEAATKYLDQTPAGLKHKVRYGPTDTLLFWGFDAYDEEEEGNDYWNYDLIFENRPDGSPFAGVTQIAFDTGFWHDPMDPTVLWGMVGGDPLRFYLDRLPDLEKVTYIFSPEDEAREKLSSGLELVLGSDCRDSFLDFDNVLCEFTDLIYR